MSTTLSYSKFTGLLSQHRYLYSTIYYTKSHGEKSRKAVFFEVRLPRTQKSVLIFISPTKYNMILPSETVARAVEVISSELPSTGNEKVIANAKMILTEKSVNYLLNTSVLSD